MVIVSGNNGNSSSTSSSGSYSSGSSSSSSNSNNSNNNNTWQYSSTSLLPQIKIAADKDTKENLKTFKDASK